MKHETVLTDEDINKIADQGDIFYVSTGEGDHGDNRAAICPFARAIEQAILTKQAEKALLEAAEYHCIGYIDGYGREIQDKDTAMNSPRAVYVRAVR